MKTITTLLVCMLINFGLQAQYNCDNLSMGITNGQFTRITFKNLRVFPIYATNNFFNQHKDVGDYSNLKDAMAGKKIEIREVDMGGSVNTLMVKNTSADTIYVMAGQVVKGGKQDRVIAQDFIIEPGKEVDVGAFCVEKGRWNSESNSINVNGDADAAYFMIYDGGVSTKLRKTVSKDKDQHKVWKEVDEVTAANAAKTETSTYTALKDSKAFTENLDEYLNYFKSKLLGRNDIIGLVAVSGNNVLGCDLFATNHLFVTALEPILQSHATEVITNGTKITISDAKVQQYLDGFLLDEQKQEDVLDKQGTIFRYKNAKLHIASY